MRYLPVWIGAAVAAGAAAGMALPPPPSALGLPCLATVCAAGLVAGRRAPRAVLACALGAMAMTTAVVAGRAEGLARRPPVAAIVERAAGEPVTIEGTLDEDATPGANGARLRVDLDAVETAGARRSARGIVAVTVGGASAGERLPEWRGGRRVRLPATLRRPARYLNAGVPDHALALARRGLVLVGSAKSASLVEVIGEGAWPDEAAAALRAHARRSLEAHVGRHDRLSGAVATGILIGERAALDAEIVERLQAAGTYHVMAISGGNIAILAGAILGLLWLARVPPAPATLAAIALLVGYAHLVGGGASVVRATVMAVCYLALRLIDQRAAPVNALGAAAALMLAAAPLAVADAAFLLTVGATGAIVLLATRLQPPASSRLLRGVTGVVAASLATEIVLLPAGAGLFNRVTAAGLVLNLAAVPLMTVVQLGSMAVVAADPVVPLVARAAGWVTHLAAAGLVESSRLVEWMPWLARRGPSPAAWTVALYLAALAAVFAVPRLSGLPGRWRVRLRRAAMAVAAAAAGWILLHPDTWPWPWRADGLLRVTFLDVGQGDATLVRLPDGRALLVDAGGLGGTAAFDVGARVVAPALWAAGVGRLEALVLSHGDPDHVGGAAAVLRDFRPRRVWEGVPVPTHAPLLRLRREALALGSAWRAVTTGERDEMGGVRVTVLHPPAPDWERPRVRNDDSIVLELRYGAVSVVLAGDVGRDVERDLVRAIRPAPIVVLKVPHHGSRTSSSDALLDALRPALAVVSCGRDNRYGHPAPDVLARYASRGIRVLRTDRLGAISVVTGGRTIAISGWRRRPP